MAFLFNRSNRPKTPQDLVRSVRESISRLDVPSEKKRAIEEITKCLNAMKNILIGDGEADPVPEQVVLLSQEIYTSDLLQILSLNLYRFEFEAKKDFTSIFNTLLRRQVGETRYPTVEYLAQKGEILLVLTKGYENHEVALNCGTVLREAFKHEQLAKIVLYSPVFWSFFDYVETGVFDVAGDAFSTFKELLVRHKQLTADFLTENYSTFFKKYDALLHSPNYVTKRQSVKLLSEILLARENLPVMRKWIESIDNLMLMMNLLRDRSRNIQFEAFHVFKLFVANPRKSEQVEYILVKNRDKLMVFLQKFQSDRQDEQFADEKNFLLQKLSALKGSGGGSGSAGNGIAAEHMFLRFCHESISGITKELDSAANINLKFLHTLDFKHMELYSAYIQREETRNVEVKKMEKARAMLVDKDFMDRLYLFMSDLSELPSGYGLSQLPYYGLYFDAIETQTLGRCSCLCDAHATPNDILRSLKEVFPRVRTNRADPYLKWIRTSKICLPGTLRGPQAEEILAIHLEEEELERQREKEEQEKEDHATELRKRAAKRRRESREKKKHENTAELGNSESDGSCEPAVPPPTPLRRRFRTKPIV